MIEKLIVKQLSEKAARYIHKKTDEEKDLDDLYFGMQIVINFLSIIIITTICATFLHILTDTIVSMIVFIIFRSLTGGYHLRHSEWCIVASTIILLSIPVISIMFTEKYFDYVGVICFLLIIMFSPHDPNSAFLKNNRTVCKVAALSLIMLAYSIHSPLILTAMGLQSLLLVHYKRKGE